MEFENNTNMSVSDDERRQAEMRKLTLQPLHGNVAPSEPSDTDIATKHLTSTPIANISNDVEETVRSTESQTQPAKTHRLAVGVAIVMMLVCGGILVAAIIWLR